MKAATLERMRALRGAKASFALVTEIGQGAGGAQAIVTPDAVEGDLAPSEAALAAIRDALAHDRSTTVEDGNRKLFVHVQNPPLRLIVVGAVHIAQPLCVIAQAAGYAITLVDPRGAWATAARFPGLTLLDDWPDDAMTRLAPDRRTAVVTLTHDPKLDDPALAVALRTDAFYVGALGSRKTHAKRLERLRELGLGEAELARIDAPIGLDLGGRSPAEIAIAIMAKIVQVLHAPKTAPELAEKAA